MFSITIGTEKQVAYANDIIRNPIANVDKKIEKIESDAVIIAEKYGQRDKDLDIIPVLRNAISYYEKTMDNSAEMLTADFVIKNYKENSSCFQRIMWKCLSHAFKEAGFSGENVHNWASP